MTPYFDSGVIVKIYAPEKNSAEAAALVSFYRPPCFLTQWQELEAKTALRLKAFRKEVTLAELDKALAFLAEDIRTGRWVRPVVPLFQVFAKAENLSARHAVRIGCRSLDILHVAAAQVMGADVLVTFDLRQAKLARTCGLKVKPRPVKE